MLIDSVCELTDKKNALEVKLDNPELELITLALQISEIEEMVTKVNFENRGCMSHLEKLNALDGREERSSMDLD